ncbi:hypothetical protein [Sorangium sp. So ce117]|uniref:hypothetical protein n=1 Tax=Sorangium sp. So ce117 TaxID=3133277 RepID=UPI003F5FA70E
MKPVDDKEAEGVDWALVRSRLLIKSRNEIPGGEENRLVSCGCFFIQFAPHVELRPELIEKARELVTAASKEWEDRIRDRPLVQAHEKYSWVAKLPVERAASAQSAIILIERTFAVVSVCVPKRIADEEIGDACEIVVEHFKRSSALWPAYWKLVTVVLWVMVNTIGYCFFRLRGSRKASGE